MRKVRFYDLLYGSGKQGFMMSLVVRKAGNISIQAKWLMMSSPKLQKIIIASKMNRHIHVPRERVANILCELNPAKTRERRQRRLARRRYTSYRPHFSLSKETVSCGFDRIARYISVQ